MKTNSKLKKGDPISTHTEGKSDVSSASRYQQLHISKSSCICFYYNSQHVQHPSTKTQSSEYREFCHFQDGNQHMERESQFFQEFHHPMAKLHVGEDGDSQLLAV